MFCCSASHRRAACVMLFSCSTGGQLKLCCSSVPRKGTWRCAVQIYNEDFRHIWFFSVAALRHIAYDLHKFLRSSLISAHFASIMSCNLCYS